MTARRFLNFGAGFLAACIFFSLISWREAPTCEPIVAVSADKMNVLYIGVDNPLTIVSSDGTVRAEQVSIEGGTLSDENSKFVVHVTQPGICKISVKTANGVQHFNFRVKRIPDPVAAIGMGTLAGGGGIGAADFKQYRGIISLLNNFDFDARCSVQSFQMVQVRDGEELVSVMNEGSAFNAMARKAIDTAQKGDIFLFEQIKSQCPGDKEPRDLGTISFRITH